MNFNPTEQILKEIEELERLIIQGLPHTRDKEKIEKHTQSIQKVIDEKKCVLKSFYKS